MAGLALPEMSLDLIGFASPDQLGQFLSSIFYRHDGITPNLE